MPRKITILTLVIAGAIAAIPLRAQDAETRKVVTRVQPQYPPTARLMHLTGTVKVDAVVLANGTVKDVAVKGGHPVLVQATVDAVRRWKWAPATKESTEAVTVKFDPDN